MNIFLLFLTIILPLMPIALFSLYKFQEKLIFFPEKLPLTYQFEFDEKFEELNFQTETNIVINALLFRADSSKGIILYFHGNAGALNSWGAVAKDFLPLNYDVFIVDFRGYGKSSGIISSEKQLHDDAAFIYNEIQKNNPEKDIIIYGRSLGSGIAARLGAIHKPKALILETPFYSMRDVARSHFPFLPTFLVLKYKFENFIWLEQVKCPVFLIHGTRDEVVPYSSSSRLAKLFDNIHLITIEGGTHNNLSEYTEFHTSLKNILL